MSFTLPVARQAWQKFGTQIGHDEQKSLAGRDDMETTTAANAQPLKKTGGTDFSQVPIIQCAYQLALETQKLVAGFPRNVRYQLGDRLATITQDFFEGACKANFIRDPRQRWGALDALSAELFTLRMTVRMAKDLKTVSVGQFRGHRIIWGNTAR